MRALLAALGFPGHEDPAVRLLRAPTASTCRTGTRANCVVYTGTHDNDTARGWYARSKPEERERVWDYLGCDGREIEWALIRAAYDSVAERAIVPLQDVLGLGSEARMNTPAQPEGSWAWRAPEDAFRPELAARLRRMAELSGRRAASAGSSSRRADGLASSARAPGRRKGHRMPRHRLETEAPSTFWSDCRR